MNTSKNKGRIVARRKSTIRLIIICLMAGMCLMAGCDTSPSNRAEIPPKDTSSNIVDTNNDLPVEDKFDSTERQTICSKPDAIIGIDLARERRRALISSSKLDTITTNTPELPSFQRNGRTSYHIKLENFIKLLKYYRDHQTRYNGMRVHFACFPQTESVKVPKERVGQLVLLFVPTTFVNSANRRKDDTSQIFALYEDQEIKLTESEARQWVDNYKNTVGARLQEGGRILLNNSHFEETRSHWYFMETLSGNGRPPLDPAYDPGLIKFLECKMNDRRNPLVRAEVVFAAFLRGEAAGIPEHQLTVLFRFHPKETEDKFRIHERLFRPDPYTFGLSIIRQDNGDTGFPCPPAANCDGSFTEPPPNP